MTVKKTFSRRILSGGFLQGILDIFNLIPRGLAINLEKSSYYFFIFYNFFSFILELSYYITWKITKIKLTFQQVNVISTTKGNKVAPYKYLKVWQIESFWWSLNHSMLYSLEAKSYLAKTIQQKYCSYYKTIRSRK